MACIPDQVSDSAKRSALANWVGRRFPSNAAAAAAPELPASLREAALRVDRRDAPEPREHSDSGCDEYWDRGWDRNSTRSWMR